MDIASLSVVGPAFTGALDTGAICGLPNGPNNYCDPVAAAYEAAVKAGMVVVAAAGNDGYNGYYYPMLNSINSPATAPSVIGVGATVNSHVFGPSVSVNAVGCTLEPARGSRPRTAMPFSRTPTTPATGRRTPCSRP